MTSNIQGRKFGDREERVERLMRMLQQVSEGLTRMTQEMAEASSLHVTDVNALSVLSRHTEEPLTIGELRSQLGLSPAAMTKLVDRIEKAGHVRRTPDAHDRRQVRLEMTEATSVFEGVLDQYLDQSRASLDSYDDAQLEAAERFLADVRDALPGGK